MKSVYELGFLGAVHQLRDYAEGMVEHYMTAADSARALSLRGVAEHYEQRQIAFMQVVEYLENVERSLNK